MTHGQVVHGTLIGASIATTGGLGVYAWRNRTEQGARAFFGLMVAFTLYSAAHLVGLLTLHPRWRLFWENLQWTGTAVAPALWLLFVLEYTGYDELLDRRAVAAVAAVPVATVVLVWTNPAHELVWADHGVTVVSGLAIFEQSFGPWIWAFAIFGYSTVAVGAVLLVRLIRRSESLYGDQAVLLVVGIVAPAVASLATLFDLTPVGTVTIDVTPYAFALTGVSFGYALFRHRLFDLVPASRRLGRSSAVRDLEDGIVIVDADDRVTYCNAAAADLLDREATAVLGAPVGSVVDDPNLALDSENSRTELERGDRVHEVHTSPIRDRRGRLVGHTLVIREVTARKRRERRLARQRDELVRLEELNALIRGVNRALVGASTRAEVERAVCERLTDRDRFEAACIADVGTWNGDAERWTVATADGRNGDGEVGNEAESDGEGGSAAEGEGEAERRDEVEGVSPTPVPDGEVTFDGDAAGVVTLGDPDGDDAWTVVPVTYGRTVYGALGLRPRREGNGLAAVSDREREVLSELGELVGHAIEAVENRRLLAAESVVELDLRSADAGDAFVRATGATDAHLELTGLVPRAGGGHLAYVSVEGGSVERVADALSGEAGATRAIREDADGGLLEWTVPDETLLGTLVDRGAKVLRATAEDGTARFVAEVASDADVRALVDRLQGEFPDTWPEAVRERDRPVERADSVPGRGVEGLTDRQGEALEAAYRAGYYDWPRESTAEEVAETLDIAPSTLHAHLRKAERSLLADLFDEHAPRQRE